MSKILSKLQVGGKCVGNSGGIKRNSSKGTKYCFMNLDCVIAAFYNVDISINYVTTHSLFLGHWGYC